MTSSESFRHAFRRRPAPDAPGRGAPMAADPPETVEPGTGAPPRALRLPDPLRRIFAPSSARQVHAGSPPNTDASAPRQAPTPAPGPPQGRRAAAAPPRLTGSPTLPEDGLRPRLRAWRDAAVDTLWPPSCALCRAEVQTPHGLCAACWRDVQFIASPLCIRCGAPVEGVGDAALCDFCLHARLEFDEARAATVYEGGARRAAMALKHGDRLDLARPAAIWMRRAGWPLLERAELICPVPLHWTRYLMRRFNQSAELARALQALTAAEGPHPAPTYAPDLLRRTRATGSQGGRGRAARHAAMQGVFSVAPGQAARIRGRRVLLVDDVMTTGATLSACAAALKAGGAAGVDAVCLARVAPQRKAAISER